MSAFISVLCVIVVVYLPLLILEENDEIVNEGVGVGTFCGFFESGGY